MLERDEARAREAAKVMALPAPHAARCRLCRYALPTGPKAFCLAEHPHAIERLPRAQRWFFRCRSCQWRSEGLSLDGERKCSGPVVDGMVRCTREGCHGKMFRRVPFKEYDVDSKSDRHLNSWGGHEGGGQSTSSGRSNLVAPLLPTGPSHWNRALRDYS